MPKNIIIFHHHNEKETSHLVLQSLGSLHKDGFDTICTESSSAMMWTPQLITEAMAVNTQLKRYVETTLRCNIEDIALGKVSLSALHKLYVYFCSTTC